MLVVESGKSKVVVDCMILEVLEWVHGGPRPLPYIADDIEYALSRELVYRSRRRVATPNVEVLCLCLIKSSILKHRVVLVLCWQTDSLTELCRQPAAVGACLKAVDLNRPVPRQINLL